MIPEQQFKSLMESIGLPDAGEEYPRFALYCRELQEWNEKINLTAITDDEGVAVKHFADSLLPLTMCELPRNARLVDVGSGAGFPSLPMALVRGDLRITFLTACKRDSNFSMRFARAWRGMRLRCIPAPRMLRAAPFIGNATMWRLPVRWRGWARFASFVSRLSSRAGCSSRSRGHPAAKSWRPRRMPSAFWAAR